MEEMKYIHFIALTEDGQHRVALPLELAETINEQFKQFPEGVPIKTGNLEITALALMIATPALAKKRPMLIFGGDED